MIVIYCTASSFSQPPPRHYRCFQIPYSLWFSSGFLSRTAFFTRTLLDNQMLHAICFFIQNGFNAGKYSQRSPVLFIFFFTKSCNAFIRIPGNDHITPCIMRPQEKGKTNSGLDVNNKLYDLRMITKSECEMTLCIYRCIAGKLFLLLDL